VDFKIFKNRILLESNFLTFLSSINLHWGLTKNLGSISSAILTFIG